MVPNGLPASDPSLNTATTTSQSGKGAQAQQEWGFGRRPASREGTPGAAPPQPRAHSALQP